MVNQSGHEVLPTTKVFAKAGLDVVIFGCSSLSTIVSAEEQISAFCIYLRLWFFNRLRFWRDAR
jgi:hypothetical protein